MTQSLGFIATGTAFCAAALRYWGVIRGERSIDAIEVATAKGFFAGLLISLIGLYLVES